MWLHSICYLFSHLGNGSREDKFLSLAYQRHLCFFFKDELNRKVIGEHTLRQREVKSPFLLHTGNQPQRFCKRARFSQFCALSVYSNIKNTGRNRFANWFQLSLLKSGPIKHPLSDHKLGFQIIPTQADHPIYKWAPRASWEITTPRMFAETMLSASSGHLAVCSNNNRPSEKHLHTNSPDRERTQQDGQFGLSIRNKDGAKRQNLSAWSPCRNEIPAVTDRVQGLEQWRVPKLNAVDLVPELGSAALDRNAGCEFVDLGQFGWTFLCIGLGIPEKWYARRHFFDIWSQASLCQNGCFVFAGLVVSFSGGNFADAADLQHLQEKEDVCISPKLFPIHVRSTFAIATKYEAQKPKQAVKIIVEIDLHVSKRLKQTRALSQNVYLVCTVQGDLFYVNLYAHPTTGLYKTRITTPSWLQMFALGVVLSNLSYNWCTTLQILM